MQVINAAVNNPVLLCADASLFAVGQTTFPIQIVYSATNIVTVAVEVTINNGVAYFTLLPTKVGLCYVQKDSTVIAAIKSSSWGVDEALSKLVDCQMGSWSYDKETGKMTHYTLAGNVLSEYAIVDTVTASSKTFLS